MPKIRVLPHATKCPNGKTFQAETGANLIDVLLKEGIAIDHACEKQGVCATCHVIIKEGFDSLSTPKEKEEETLDFAWGLAPHSRLSCQVIIGTDDLVVEIPKYHTHIVS